MRAEEFITEDLDATPFIELVHTAQVYLSKLFNKGIADRSAVTSVIDVLHTRGVDHTVAAQATKKAFVNLKGSDVTTEE